MAQDYGGLVRGVDFDGSRAPYFAGHGLDAGRKIGLAFNDDPTGLAHRILFKLRGVARHHHRAGNSQFTACPGQGLPVVARGVRANSATGKSARSKLAQRVGHPPQLECARFLKVFAFKVQLGPRPGIEACGLHQGRAVQGAGQLGIALRQNRGVQIGREVGVKGRLHGGKVRDCTGTLLPNDQNFGQK